MHAVLEGRDSLVVLPTGGGKSLCFQAPALVMEHAARAADADLLSGPAKAGHYDGTDDVSRSVRLQPDEIAVEDENFGYDVDWDALPAADAAPRSVKPQADLTRQGFALVV